MLEHLFQHTVDKCFRTPGTRASQSYACTDVAAPVPEDMAHDQLREAVVGVKAYAEAESTGRGRGDVQQLAIVQGDADGGVDGVLGTGVVSPHNGWELVFEYHEARAKAEGEEAKAAQGKSSATDSGDEGAQAAPAAPVLEKNASLGVTGCA